MWNRFLSSRWPVLIVAWSFLIVLCLILLGYHFISGEVFFSVLLATVLGHTSAAAIAAQTDKLQRDLEQRQLLSQQRQEEERIARANLLEQNRLADEQAKEAARKQEVEMRQEEERQRYRSRTLSLLLHELESNDRLVCELRDYQHKMAGMGDQEFMGRKRDPLLDRFQLTCREHAWEDVLAAVADAQTVEAVGDLYRELALFNRILENVGEFVMGYRSTQTNSPAQAYKDALSALFWNTSGRLYGQAIYDLAKKSSDLIQHLRTKKEFA